MLVIGLATLGAAGIALGRIPHLLWAIVPGTTAVSALCVPLLLKPSVSYNIDIKIILFYCLAIPGVVALVGVAVLSAVLAIYLVVTTRFRTRKLSARSFFEVAWRTGGFQYGFAPLALLVVAFALTWVLLAAVILVAVAIQVLTGFVGLNPWIGVALTLLAIAISAARICSSYSNKDSTWTLLGKGSVHLAKLVIFSGVVVLVVGHFVMWIETTAFIRWIRSIFDWFGGLGFWSAMGLVILNFFQAILIILLLYSFIIIYRMVARLRSIDSMEDSFDPGGVFTYWARNPLTRQSRSPGVQEWVEQVKKAGSEKQADLLLASGPQALGLDTQGFVEVLKGLRPAIKQEEPARSAYWQLRQRYERIVKLEREG